MTAICAFVSLQGGRDGTPEIEAGIRETVETLRGAIDTAAGEGE